MQQTSPEVLLLLNCICYPLICWVPFVVLITLKVTGRVKFRSPLSYEGDRPGQAPQAGAAARRDPAGFKSR